MRREPGNTTPVEQLSFHDSFELYATITKPCVHFPSSEVYENGEKEAFLSELEDEIQHANRRAYAYQPKAGGRAAEETE